MLPFINFVLTPRQKENRSILFPMPLFRIAEFNGTLRLNDYFQQIITAVIISDC
jgi:hypothetical protein